MCQGWVGELLQPGSEGVGGTSDLPGEEVSLDALGEQETIYGAIS